MDIDECWENALETGEFWFYGDTEGIDGDRFYMYMFTEYEYYFYDTFNGKTQVDEPAVLNWYRI